MELSTPWKSRRIERAGMLAALIVSGAASLQAQDVNGSKDHAAISRYAGSVIIGYDFKKFDQFVLPLGPVEVVYPPGAPVAKKSQTVEGRVTLGPQAGARVSPFARSATKNPAS